MNQIEQLPGYIEEILPEYDTRLSEVRLCSTANLSAEGEFYEVWLVVTGEKLLVFTGERVSRENYKGAKRKKEKTTYAWREMETKIFAIRDIGKLEIENLASSGRVTATVEDEPIVLCRFSNTYMQKLRFLTKLFGKIKEGKEITEEDFNGEPLPPCCPKCGLRYPDNNRRLCPKCMNKKSIFLRILSFVPRYKYKIALILLCMVASSLLNLASPYISGRVMFDQVLKEGGNNYGKVGWVVLLMVATRLAALLISIIYGRINAGVTAEVVYDLKTDIFTAMQRLSMSFFSNRQTGSLMTRVNQDANHLQYFFHDGLPYFIVNAANIVGICLIMLLMNWKLALMVLLPTPFIILFLRTIYPMLSKLFTRRFLRSSIMNSLINDTLSGIRVVKAFGKESSEVDRFTDANTAVYTAEMNVQRTINTVFPLVHFGMTAGSFIVWGLGGWQVVNAGLTFGELMTFVGYMGMLYGPLDFMSRVVDWWSNCMNSAQRIFEIIDAVPDVMEKPEAVRVKPLVGDVEFRNVFFSYEPNKPVLQDVSFSVKAGEMIGLVGHTGAGKSTVANLVSRLYDIKEGEVFLDGINIKEIAFEDLRSQIGMVLQETYLFMGTIADNIRYARPEASREDIIRAAKAANAHNFIMKLPDGYDTVIGRGGRDLSGGERQRVSIARTLLHNPRILILDEATASVDTETEGQIQEALQKLVQGRTTISIAHRLSTLRDADWLLVLDGGKVVESGTHAELAKAKGAYYKLLQKQSEAMKIRGVG